MEQIQKVINDVIHEEKLIYGVFSNVRKGIEKSFTKVTVKPVLIKQDRLIQFTYQYEKKVVHENLDEAEAIEKSMHLIEAYFRQGMIYAYDGDYQILVSKSNKAKLLKKQPSRNTIDFSHNRKKSYIINEGEFNEFFFALGIMDARGQVVKKKYDKFRQINRYLEIVSDCIPHFNGKKHINIVDFGCGKAYLTFALYHYLVDIMKFDVNIIGLDLKEDVIEHCNELATSLNYENLNFIHGDIKSFDTLESIDMVVSLHACDIATDESLGKAVKWGAEIILAVPCCQHEFFKKIHNPVMENMERHGLIKERLSSLVTDSLRANVLELMGYQTQVLEFIDMEHTPKNILIRAFKKDFDKTDAVKRYKDFKQFWGLKPYIEEVMGEELMKLIK